jgi:hypothetical protein
MDTREIKQRKKSDLAASSQFLMIAIVTAVMLIVLAVWHPWATQPVNGVPQSVVATASP